MSRSVSSQVEVAVDAQTAFGAFTGEMDLWWVRGPANFFDAARATAKVREPGVGGRILEIYGGDDALKVARITAWEPGIRLAWDNAVDDVRTEDRVSCRELLADGVRARFRRRRRGGDPCPGAAWHA